MLLIVTFESKIRPWQDAAHCRRATSIASTFAMRRSAVRSRSAPPTPNPSPLHCRICAADPSSDATIVAALDCIGGRLPVV